MNPRLLAIVVPALLSGCGFIADIATEQRVYGGVRADVRLIENPVLPHSSSREPYYPLILFGVLDIPMSVVLDTLFLPLTIPLSLGRPAETPR